MNHFTRKVGLLQYLYLRFQTSMKCSNCVCKVPKHGSELHILLPWVTVTVHWVSWLPACIVCLHILSTVLNYHYTFHLLNSRTSCQRWKIKSCKKISRGKWKIKSYLPGSHHWILSPRPPYILFELKLLLPAYRCRLYPGLGNTHSHKLWAFFCQNFLVSFDNCYKL